MKVLAFNASPRKQNSTTDIIMDMFLESAKEAGAEIEKHYVLDLDIKGCTGCFSCWTKTPGKCIHRDDMDWILPKIVESDILYLGTPIFHYNIIHYLQRLRERTLPLNLPEMEIIDGETHHPSRYESKKRQTVLAAVCGFPDLVNFKQAKGLFPNAIHIFLPSSEILRHPVGKESISFFTDAVKEAGRQLVVDFDVTDGVRKNLVVDYPPEFKEMIVKMTNENFARSGR